MSFKSSAFAAAIAVAMSLNFLPAKAADDAISAPGQKEIGEPTTSVEVIPELAVLNAAGASIKDGKLVLTSVAANAVVFTDRPYRAAGQVLTSDFLKQWGGGKDSFKSDPPNATVSILGKSGSTIEDAVVVLKSPIMADGTLSFDVDVLEGSLDGGDGPAAVFVDFFGGGHGGHDGSGDHGDGPHFHSNGPSPAFHAGWYRHHSHNGWGYLGAGLLGAAAGAVATSAPGSYVYPPYMGYAPYQLYPAAACGYEFEPPCY